MEQLPKIVQQRLQATAQAGVHPDPDLLAAFAEKSLNDRERAQVLEHLGLCPACRNLVSLALPEMELASNPAGWRWLTWPVLRWGALAACVVVLGAAVTLRYQRRTQATPVLTEISSAPAAAQPALTLESRDSDQPRQKPARRAPSPAPMPAEGSLAAAAKAAKPRERAEGKSVAIASALNGVPETDGVKRKPEEPNLPPAERMTRDRLASADVGQAAVPSEERPLLGQSPGAANQVSSTPSAKLPVMEPPAIERNEAQAEYRETVTVQAQAGQTQASPAALTKTKDESRKKVAGAGALAAATLGERKADMKSAAVASPGSNQELPVASSTGARWTIAGDGALQRSFDAGRTWQTVPVGASVVFRALAVNDSDIWAGGNAGALYHSSDAGQHWTQIKPLVENRVLTGDVIAVEFSDARHGKLTNTRHEIWTTSDAGQTWQLP
jgi:hypothetical protein